MSARKHLVAIQYLRGIAAIAVALAHIAGLQHSLAPNEKPVLHEFAGFWGVDIFFVISGFIIAYITREVMPGWRSSCVFMFKRLVRIVPAYWCFTVLIYFADTQHWFSDQKNTTNLALLLKSLFFIKPGFPLLFVGWTLTLEMFFYLVFSISLWRFFPGGRVAVVALVFSVLAGLSFLVDSQQRYFVFFTQPVILEFVVGMLLGYVYPHSCKAIGMIAGRSVLLVGVMGLLVITFALPVDTLVAQRVIWWGIPAVLIVAGALHAGLATGWRTLHAAGEVSYSLYLCHMPCAYVSAVIVRHYFENSSIFLSAYLVIAIGLTVVTAVVSWWLLERMPQQLLRRYLRGEPV